jgi:plasmid stabilization system protein ParE
MKLRYERGALADLAEIFAYIAADNREVAGRVVARIERVAKRIAASPQIGGITRKPGSSLGSLVQRCPGSERIHVISPTHDFAVLNSNY